MPTRAIQIPQLRGISSNPVEGVDFPLPDEIFNLDFAYTGGLSPYGRMLTCGKTAPTGGSLVGYDHGGYFTFLSSTSVAVLHKQCSSAKTTTVTDSSTQFGLDAAIHIPGFGYYRGITGTRGTAIGANKFHAQIAGFDVSGNVIQYDAAGTWDITAARANSAADRPFADVRVAGILVTRYEGGTVIRGATRTNLSSSTNFDVQVTAPTAMPVNSWIEVYLQNGPTQSSADPVDQNQLGWLIAVLKDASQTKTITSHPDTSNLSYATFRGHPIWKLAETHQRRTYGLVGKNTLDPQLKAVTRNVAENVVYTGDGVEKITGSDPDELNFSGDVITYTDIDRPFNELPPYTNFFLVHLQAGNDVTAFVSSPAGLLICATNEIHIAGPDPALPEFSVRKLSSLIGHDDLGQKQKPTVLGGNVYVIYKGEIWSLALGDQDADGGAGVENISLPVFDKTDKFVQVVSEPFRNHIVARTAGNKIFRFDAELQEWINDFVQKETGFTSPSNLNLLPGWGDVSSLYFHDFGQNLNKIVTTGTLAVSTIKWEAIDDNDKGLMKGWKRVEVFTDTSYSPAVGFPTLTYDIRAGGHTGTTTAESLGGGRFLFTLPNGLVGTTATMEMSFGAMTIGSKIEPPINISYAPRYRERGV